MESILPMLRLRNVAVAFNSYFTKSIQALHMCVFLWKLLLETLCVEHVAPTYTDHATTYSAQCVHLENVALQHNQTLQECLYFIGFKTAE
jgi:hypothetical protein